MQAHVKKKYLFSQITITLIKGDGNPSQALLYSSKKLHDRNAHTSPLISINVTLVSSNPATVTH
jgi:hypothetical protein